MSIPYCPFGTNPDNRQAEAGQLSRTAEQPADKGDQSCPCC